MFVERLCYGRKMLHIEICGICHFRVADYS